jgi:hypothetical protein
MKLAILISLLMEWVIEDAQLEFQIRQRMKGKATLKIEDLLVILILIM